MQSEKSKNMKEKIKFFDRFGKISVTTKSIYQDLESGIIQSCKASNYGYTDKPDFRITNGEVMIELVPMIRENKVRVMLRVDGDQNTITNATNAQLEEFSGSVSKSNNRQCWIGFSISNPNQVQPAIQLISAAYQYRNKNHF